MLLLKTIQSSSIQVNERCLHAGILICGLKLLTFYGIASAYYKNATIHNFKMKPHPTIHIHRQLPNNLKPHQPSTLIFEQPRTSCVCHPCVVGPCPLEALEKCKARTLRIALHKYTTVAEWWILHWVADAPPSVPLTVLGQFT